MSPPPDGYHVTLAQGTLRVTVLAAGYTLYPDGYPTPCLSIGTRPWPDEQYLTIGRRDYTAYGRYRFNHHGTSPFRCEQAVFVRCRDRQPIAMRTATWTVLSSVVDTAIKQFVAEHPQWRQQSLQLGLAQHRTEAAAALAKARDELTAVEDTWQRWLDTYSRLP